MTSKDDVHRLRGDGWSIRRIADRLGLSKSAVHRKLSVDPEDDDGFPDPWSDDDGAGDGADATEERWPAEATEPRCLRWR
jgi:hypothetical protein